MGVTSLVHTLQPCGGSRWEVDWAALRYVAVGEAGARPIGLLVLGCRRDHWYTDEDVDYASALGVTLTPLVAALRGPLGRLNESEGEVGQLVSYGLSTQKIA